ncbi:DNA photolyase, FAD-binding/Cryptochrome [Tricladium varicosporioides]|nr:DNA photolyase, FAD-binding/Cryptochrome [Hymenoscyphus varicosporioides]
MTNSNILIYLLRRDLRVSDNPVFHSLANDSKHEFTHLLPLYVFSAQQIEVEGFIPEDKEVKCPYPEARSKVGNFWRCGPHRCRFLSECLWDLKSGLEKIGSSLCLRVGTVDEVIKQMLKEINEKGDAKVAAVWMTAEEGTEEKREERAVKTACGEAGADFKTWVDEKYFKDDRDLPFSNPQDVPNVFTDYRNKVEPLREAPRDVLLTPAKGELPSYPADNAIPAQKSPFSIPNSLGGLQEALLRPLLAQPLINNPPSHPDNVESAHPFKGGESNALARLDHLISSGCMTTYKDTRNGLLGTEFSTKLSAYLVLGCITSRQIHSALLGFEDGTDGGKYEGVQGYGKGENGGTKSIRFELLWRDYMRLCARKFGPKLFRLSGFREEKDDGWNSPDRPRIDEKVPTREMIERFLNGTTGMGLIDASQRELFHTGYTSNRARQNSASFFAKHLYIDWRIGAEWYECMLVDYDVASNWGNWQYLAGVGNDPRGEARIFNPVKQAFDYDPNAEYVKAWVPELRGLTDSGEVFQACTIRDEQKKQQLGLAGLRWVERPLKRIEFTIGRRGRHQGRGRNNYGRGGNRGGGGGGPPTGPRHDENQRSGERGMSRSGGRNRGRFSGRGYGGSSRGHIRGYHRGRVEGLGGREVQTGMIDKERAGQQDAATE